MSKVQQQILNLEPTKITLFKSLCIASMLCIFETYFFYNISTKDAMKGLEYNIRSASAYIRRKNNFTQEQEIYIKDISENYQKMKKREIARRNKENQTYFVNAILIISILIAATIGTGVLSKNIIRNYTTDISILVVVTLLSISVFQYFFYKNIASKYQYQSQEEIIYAMKQYIANQEKQLR